MLMPETAMNIDDFSPSRKHDIGLAWEMTAMQSVSVSKFI
jgi:hypothetical protein